MREQTFVSAVYNLVRRDGTVRRSPEVLLQHGAYLLSLPVPLVLFVDPEFEEPCWEARRRLGLEALTRVVVRPLDEFDLAALVPLLPRFRMAVNVDSVVKETPWFQVLMWSKFDMVAEAIESNPFGTEHFAWLDFAVAHVAVPPLTPPGPSEKIAMLEMMPVAPSEVEDRAEFYCYERGRMAGGFFWGSGEALLHLRSRFSAELAAALALGLRPNEQMVLSLLSALEPDLFEMYYGDYAQILLNWDGPRRRAVALRGGGNAVAGAERDGVFPEPGRTAARQSGVVFLACAGGGWQRTLDRHREDSSGRR